MNREKENQQRKNRPKKQKGSAVVWVGEKVTFLFQKDVLFVIIYNIFFKKIIFCWNYDEELLVVVHFYFIIIFFEKISLISLISNFENFVFLKL